ncbi:hypothetical protein, partial [Cardiobacterium hominis]|uniref:hypothetical protein n=1 Tax=Cardiobacterium hominis TaxID=2718 RepID=UPI0028E5A83B
QEGGVKIREATKYSHTPKDSDKARRRRQYAVVRRGGATPYEAFGGLLYTLTPTLPRFAGEGKIAGF